MVKKIEVSGYDAFKKKLAETLKDNKNVQLNILFTGDKDKNGQSWCPDCNVAEPHLTKAVEEHGKKDSIFMVVQVGERAYWKDIKNPFRKDPDTRLDVIPTLIRWKSPERLDGDLCAKDSLLEMFFKESDEENAPVEDPSSSSEIRQIDAFSYDDFKKKMRETLKGNEKLQLNVLFWGNKDAKGHSWCPDCNHAEPSILQSLKEHAKKGSVLMVVHVGDRNAWFDRKNLFRTDHDINLSEIPTLLRWKTPIRLQGKECAKKDLLEMFFKETDEDE